MLHIISQNHYHQLSNKIDRKRMNNIALDVDYLQYQQIPNEFFEEQGKRIRAIPIFQYNDKDLKKLTSTSLTRSKKQIFNKYEKPNFNFIELNQFNSVKWINNNLNEFKFIQIIYFFDKILNKMSKNKIIPEEIKLTRDEKRSKLDLYNYLESYWEILQPALEQNIHSSFYTAIYNECLSK